MIQFSNIVIRSGSHISEGEDNTTRLEHGLCHDYYLPLVCPSGGLSVAARSRPAVAVGHVVVQGSGSVTYHNDRISSPPNEISRCPWYMSCFLNILGI